GTYSCRGMKGQSARTGGRRRPGFEGGQTPYYMRMPKLKGFRNINQVEYQVVNIGELNIFDDKEEITPEKLHQKKLISKKNLPVKLLGGKGEVEKEFKIIVHKASKTAIQKIEAKKGKVELLVIDQEKKSDNTEK